MPKVSVVIPNYNHGQFLPEAVASVAPMRRDDVEIIVVDDGSTDELTRNEVDKIEASGIRVIRQENRGLAAARNAGITSSKGQYIFPLDADDRARPAPILHATEVLDAQPEIGVVYGDAQLFGVRSGHWTAGPFDPIRLMKKNYISCSALFRREVWEQVGGYDGTMPVQGLEDWDFWVGAYERGWQFAYFREPLFEYRQHHVSMLSNARKFEGKLIEFVAAKHGALYRREWMRLADEHESGKATFRNLRRIVKERVKHKLGMNGNHAKS